MAPSVGYHLVPSLYRAAKHIIDKSAAFIRSQLPRGAQTAREAALEPIYARSQYLNGSKASVLERARAAAGQKRGLHTFVRRVAAEIQGYRSALRPLRTPITKPSWHTTRTGRALLSNTARTPFASTFRPNLTGGTLHRTAGGYGLGGNGVRHFSHIGAGQTHVVQNVAVAMRALLSEGKKVHFDGTDRKGQMKFRVSSRCEEDVRRHVRDAVSRNDISRGARLEFQLAPVFTSGLKTVQEESMEDVARDITNAVSSLVKAKEALVKLQKLGTLPVKQVSPTTIAVHFPGCDAVAVEALCIDLDISMGVIREDSAWQDDHDVKMALLFPFAPSESADGVDEPFVTPPRYDGHEESLESRLSLPVSSATYSPVMVSHDESSSLESDEPLFEHTPSARSLSRDRESGTDSLLGIYEFLAACDAADGRLRRL